MTRMIFWRLSSVKDLERDPDELDKNAVTRLPEDLDGKAGEGHFKNQG